jgi:hypothetical protein
MRLLLAFAVALTIPGTGHTQLSTRVVGRVTTVETNSPIAGVAVTLGTVSVTSDSRGLFVITPAPTGTHAIRFEVLGYQVRHDTVTLTEGETSEIAVRLSRDPIPLPPIQVSVRSRWLDSNGYYERRTQSGLSGRFIDRAEIERRNPTFVTDLFHDVSGARVEHGLSRRVIRFNREASGGLVQRDRPHDIFELWLVRLRGCQPTLYIDGREHRDRIIRGWGPYVDDFNLLSPTVIDAIEIYVGAATPTEFRNSDGCGVILIWTRKG